MEPILRVRGRDRTKAADPMIRKTLDRVRALIAWVAAQGEMMRVADLPKDLREGIAELGDRQTADLQFVARRLDHARVELERVLRGAKKRMSPSAKAIQGSIEAGFRRDTWHEMPSAAVFRGTLHPPASLPAADYWKLEPAPRPFEEPRCDKAGLAERATKVREKIWSNLVAQAGADPRSAAISWDDVVFPDGHERHLVTARGTKYTERELYFPSGLDGEMITGRILIPDQHPDKTSAVLYMHFHGGWYGLGTGEIHQCWNLDGLGTIADKLIDEGNIVMATDVRGFGRRRATCADGRPRPDEYNQQQDLQDEKLDSAALAETGRSRYAKRSYDDYLAFRLLQQHPLVDKDKIAALGMSMGCVRSWTLAALAGKELRAAVPLGTWPRFQDLLETNKQGCHRDAHNFRNALTDVGLDTESFVLAAAESNVLAIMGDQDPSSPGWRKVFDYGTWASRTLGRGRFDTMTMLNTGHTWTPQAIDSALKFLNLSFFGEHRLNKPLSQTEMMDYAQRVMRELRGS